MAQQPKRGMTVRWKVLHDLPGSSPTSRDVLARARLSFAISAMDLTEKPGDDNRDCNGGRRRRQPIAVAPSVRVVIPYEAITSQLAIEAAPDHHRCFKLDWNECTLGPSPRVREAIEKWLGSGGRMNWYPPLGSSQLVEALAGYTGLQTDHLLVTNGSDAALRLICSTYLDRGDRVVVPVPTYQHFLVFAHSRGARVDTVSGTSPFELDCSAIEEAMTRDTRLLYLVSPNNPTGVIYPPEEVKSLCLRYPRSLIVLDEAYFEFARITGISLVRELPNLVVTRTFSKAFGLAGLRVGYLAASPALVEGLSRLYNPKSVNVVAQIAAMAALEDLDHLVSYLAEVELAKELLLEFFDASTRVRVHMTPANFVLLRVDDLATVLRKLEKRGVYVRDRSGHAGLEGCLRMTVGTRQQTRQLLERVDDVFR